MLAAVALLAAALVFVVTRRTALAALQPVAVRVPGRRVALAADRLATAPVRTAPDRRALARV